MGKVTFLDFFSGIGGFRMGFENAGMKCMGHVEWDKHAQQSYKAIYGDREGYGEEYCGWDIREVRAADLPRADVWAFGAPCQDFSIAGQRSGMDGDRSSLIREVFRLIEEAEHKPEWLVYENVKGMLSSNRGWDFFGILFEMDKLGYDIEWQIFNSKDWGVPQNRERVYTIGHLRSRGGRKVFPIGENGESINENRVIGINDPKKTREEFKYESSNRFYDPKGLSPTLDAMGGGNREPKIAIQISSPDYQTKNQNGRRFKEDGDPMFTLTAQDRHGVVIRETDDGFHLCRNDAKKSSIQGTHVTYPDGTSHCLTSAHKPMTTDLGFRIRKLTPLECWRLQGFPDWAFYRAKEAGVSDSQLYKQAGNSVTVNVTEVIGRAIVEQIQ